MTLRLTILAVMLALCGVCQSAPTPYEVKQAMATYRASHAVCEACGKAGTLLHPLEVHHIKPREAFPDLAATPSNFIVLCRPDHFAAHNQDFGKYIENLREVLAMRIVKENKP